MLSAVLFCALQTPVVMRVAVTVPVDPPQAATAEVKRGRRFLFWRKDPTVTLKWQASPDFAKTKFTSKGYMVYRATASGEFVSISGGALVNALKYKDSTVKKGVAYQYRVTAWLNGVQSKPSNPVKVIP